MSSAKETFEVTLADGRVMRMTIDRRELASTMAFRLNKSRKTKWAGYSKPQRVVALEGGVTAEWVSA